MTNERPRLRRALAAIAATAAIAVTLAACGSSGSDPTNGSGGAAGEPVAGGTLVFGRTAAVNDLNLHTQIAANNAFAIDKIFEPLVSFDESGEIIPWLADYAESDDELTYTFTLRNGLMFSDGNPVTADDVVFSLETHQAVADSPLPLTAPIESIEAASETEVVITLDEPYTPFLSNSPTSPMGYFRPILAARAKQNSSRTRLAPVRLCSMSGTKREISASRRTRTTGKRANHTSMHWSTATSQMTPNSGSSSRQANWMPSISCPRRTQLK